MSRNRLTQGWRKKTLEKLDPVEAVMAEMRDYWPLTLRQIYYQLVAACSSRLKNGGRCKNSVIT